MGLLFDISCNIYDIDIEHEITTDDVYVKAQKKVKVCLFSDKRIFVQTLPFEETLHKFLVLMWSLCYEIISNGILNDIP